MKPPDQFFAQCTELGWELEPHEMDLLAAYLDLLLQVNQHINLTGCKNEDTAWLRLIYDSFLYLPFIDEPVHGIDLGTGGGVPGIPLAIMQSESQWTLVDSTQKKCSFLQDVVSTLGLQNVHIVCGRAEVIGHMVEHRATYDVVVSKAMAPMRVLLEYALPLLQQGGQLVAAKGARIDQEMREARNALKTLKAGEVTLHHSMPGQATGAAVVVVKKQQRTPIKYPRATGLPTSKPL